ncbi:MAG TPA: alkaline phosphatase family protein [Streptosporangiaceae bacterium]|nr:alkaline phosphatase family protein [Streptosporangiaceae bacterium]
MTDVSTSPACRLRRTNNGRTPSTDHDVRAVAARGGRFSARTRAWICGIVVLVAATAGLSGFTLPGTAKAQATPIKHIVVLYMENHTFDNILGYWCDRNAGRCPDGGMPSSVRLSNGDVVSPDITPDFVPKVAHSVAAQRRAIDGGKMDGWQHVEGCGANTGYACIGGYLPGQVPNVTALATQFAISDRTFSMADSPSWGGHLYAVMGQLDGFFGNNPFPARGVTPRPGWGCDSRHVTQWRSPRGHVQKVPSCIPDYSLRRANGGAFKPTPVKHVPTVLDRLHGAHKSWRIYGEPEPAGNGTLAFGYVWDICPSFAECLYTHQKDNNVPSSTFVEDANSGNLPSFAIVTPGGQDAKFSEHNKMSMTTGDDWLGQVASAVMNGPDWKSTALFITWDDCGCFYDHVRPGTNPDGTPQGPRVPLIIVSPYAKHGYTDTTATTFAGILAYAEHTLGLTALGVNDKKAYPLTHAFNYHQQPLRPAPMVYRPWPPDAYHVDMKQAMQDS